MASGKSKSFGAKEITTLLDKALKSVRGEIERELEQYKIDEREDVLEDLQCLNDDMVKCPICENMVGKYMDIHEGWTGCNECGECKKLICPECMGLTACQTGWCICRECYDYTCRDCGRKLPILDPPECYFVDLEPIDVCYKCKKELYISQ
jgi:hypothetical protein